MISQALNLYDIVSTSKELAERAKRLLADHGSALGNAKGMRRCEVDGIVVVNYKGLEVRILDFTIDPTRRGATLVYAEDEEGRQQATCRDLIPIVLPMLRRLQVLDALADI